MIDLPKIKRLFNRSKLSKNITIKHYTNTTNEYGDSELTYVDEVSVKGIIASGLSNIAKYSTGIRELDNSITIYFAGDTELKNTETDVYIFVIDGTEYQAITINQIGMFEDTPTLVYECIIKPKVI